MEITIKKSPQGSAPYMAPEMWEVMAAKSPSKVTLNDGAWGTKTRKIQLRGASLPETDRTLMDMFTAPGPIRSMIRPLVRSFPRNLVLKQLSHDSGGAKCKPKK